MNLLRRFFKKFFTLTVAFMIYEQARADNLATDTASAGLAEIEITPPLGIALGGRGAPSAPSKKVLDPLFAQVLFLKDAKGTGFVLVSLDMVGIAHELSEKIRLDIVHELGVPWNLVVLNTSHTHSGPYMI